MGPRIKGAPQHSGRYTVKLVFEGDDLEHIDRMTRVGHPVIDTVYLVWDKEPDTGWQRVVTGVSGSRAVGHRKLSMAPSGAMGVRGYKEIFDRENGAILSWTDRLPGLRNTLRQLEMTLPGQL